MEVNTLFLSLGSNQGNKQLLLISALTEIKKEIGTIDACSSIYESKAIGFESLETFYNLCVRVSTTLTPIQVLLKAQQIETLFGRKRTEERYSSRTLDIDIVFFNNQIIQEKNLIVPHPRMHERLFVLLPLNELSQHFIHPILKKTTLQLQNEIADQEKPSVVIDRKQVEY